MEISEEENDRRVEYRVRRALDIQAVAAGVLGFAGPPAEKGGAYASPPRGRTRAREESSDRESLRRALSRAFFAESVHERSRSMRSCRYRGNDVDAYCDWVRQEYCVVQQYF